MLAAQAEPNMNTNSGSVAALVKERPTAIALHWKGTDGRSFLQRVQKSLTWILAKQSGNTQYKNTKYL